MLDRIGKPWFVYRPQQLARRLLLFVRPPVPGYRTLRTAWGGRILADPSRAIGRSIVATGIYDLAVSEVIAKLVKPGSMVVDAGANVGYVSLLAARAAGERGRIIAFEPLPSLFSYLKLNAAEASRDSFSAAIELHPVALGANVGSAVLRTPNAFDTNDGLAQIVSPSTRTDRDIDVNVTTLDAMFLSERIDVLKIDVEGHEFAVLSGASNILSTGRLTHIVLEEHDPGNSRSFSLLRRYGYRIFSLHWRLRGLRLGLPDEKSVRNAYEAPSFLATLNEEEARLACSRKGWRSLGEIGFRGDQENA
jgi:FkbM family methyltransferase